MGVSFLSHLAIHGHFGKSCHGLAWSEIRAKIQQAQHTWVGQRGFWDEEKRIQKLRHKKPVLTNLSASIPWESFRSLLEQVYTHERKSNAGRKRIDPDHRLAL